MFDECHCGGFQTKKYKNKDHHGFEIGIQNRGVEKNYYITKWSRHIADGPASEMLDSINTKLV